MVSSNTLTFTLYCTGTQNFLHNSAFQVECTSLPLNFSQLLTIFHRAFRKTQNCTSGLTDTSLFFSGFHWLFSVDIVPLNFIRILTLYHDSYFILLLKCRQFQKSTKIQQYAVHMNTPFTNKMSQSSGDKAQGCCTF